MLELGRETATGSSTSAYFTWVEQQGVSLEDFEVRRSQAFWRDLAKLVPAWDEQIAPSTPHRVAEAG